MFSADKIKRETKTETFLQAVYQFLRLAQTQVEFEAFMIEH